MAVAKIVNWSISFQCYRPFCLQTSVEKNVWYIMLCHAPDGFHVRERDHVQGVRHKGGEPLAAFSVPVVVAEHRFVHIPLQVMS